MLFMLSMSILFLVLQSDATSEGGTTGSEDAESVTFTSPSSEGAYMGETFDDLGMFERDWTIAKGTSSVDKHKERWQMLPVPGGDWPADLGLTLADGSRHLSTSRPLTAPLPPGRRPIVVQFQMRLPRLQQCAGAQVRLLTGSLDRLDQVNRSTPFTLLFAAESCAHQLTFRLQLGPRSGSSETGSVRGAVSVPAGGASHRLRSYRLLVTADDTARLLLDQQPVKNISLRLLVEPETQGAETEHDSPPQRAGPEPAGPAAKLSLKPAGAVNVELWSAKSGLFLDNLIVTDSPEQADRFTAPPKPAGPHVEPAQPSILDDMDWYMDYASERPWVYALIVLGFGVPACLLISCCLPESLDLEAQRKKAEALKKKTDDDPDGEYTRGSGLHPKIKPGGLFGSRLAGVRSRPPPAGEPRRRTLRRE